MKGRQSSNHHLHIKPADRGTTVGTEIMGFLNSSPSLDYQFHASQSALAVSSSTKRTIIKSSPRYSPAREFFLPQSSEAERETKKALEIKEWPSVEWLSGDCLNCMVTANLTG